jgi:hypothetical protein
VKYYLITVIDNEAREIREAVFTNVDKDGPGVFAAACKMHLDPELQEIPQQAAFEGVNCYQPTINWIAVAEDLKIFAWGKDS